MASPAFMTQYMDAVRDLAQQVQYTDGAGQTLDDGAAADWVVSTARKAHDTGYKLMFIGNGGSAGTASHLAIDCTKNANLRSLAFNDAASLTCLGNDLGYDSVFSKQIEMQGRDGDLLIAISASGTSPNILKAVDAAKKMGITVFTLSGFKPDNPLRASGDLNAYIPSDQYGLVEVLHFAVLQAVFDISMGWDGRVMGKGPLSPVAG